jgi:monovalent cation/hydrogen antiporter
VENVAFVVLVLTIVVLSSMIGRSIVPNFPLSLIQIALGSIIAQISNWKITVAPDVFFPLILAPLLFLDGWRIPRGGLFRDGRMIISLALGLVLFTVLAAGFFIHWLIPTISLASGFALASILSPTDTVAVLSIARRAPVPRRLMLILEGESLLNDASSLVCFRFAIAAVLTGHFALGDAVASFAWMAIGGSLVGVAVCVCANVAKDWVTRRFGEEVGTQILVSLIIPFSAYLVADFIGTSGILAAVAAGIMMGIEEHQGKAAAITRIRRSAVWDALQFAGNGAVFVLLGQQLPGIVSGASRAIRQSGRENGLWVIVYVLSISLLLIAIRWFWALLSIHANSRGDESWRKECETSHSRLMAITAFAGARGAVTLAAAMTIPLSLNDGTPWPARDLTILIAAGVIVISMLSTDAGLVYLTRPFKTSTINYLQEEHQLRASSARAAVEAIELLIKEQSNQSSEELYVTTGKRVADHYRRLIDTSDDTAESSPQMRQSSEVERCLRLVALNAQRKEIYRLSRLGQQNENLIRTLVYEIDLQESQLCSRHID